MIVISATRIPDTDVSCHVIMFSEVTVMTRVYVMVNVKLCKDSVHTCMIDSI